MTAWTDQTGGSDVYAATLSCGSTLVFEARSFLPTVGESVPCLRHGYCAVMATGRSTEVTERRPGGRLRAHRRDHDELVDWLRGRSRTTIHALREQRFTLRLLAAAEREGLVAVDLEAGIVSVR